MDNNLKKRKQQDERVPRLSKEEKAYIEKISAISGYSYNTVKEIFISISICTAMQLYSKENEINIPYLFKIIIELEQNEKDVEEKYKVETNYALKNVLRKIVSGDETWLEEYCIFQIRQKLEKMLDTSVK